MKRYKEDKRNHKIHSHFGINDYYKFYIKKYNSQIDKDKYKKILEDFHLGIRDLMINESLIYQFPYIGMQLIIKKDKRRPKIVDGKLVNTTPPDWKTTNELWERDKEARDKKIVVRYNNSHTSGYVFRVYLKKFSCNIKYRSLYKFNTNRDFQRSISKRIFDINKDPMDAYLLFS